MLRRGFTLIELLIVIAVIAILVGIAIPRFLGMRDEGYFGQASAELHTLQAALEAYRIHDPNEGFPTAGAADDDPWQSQLIDMRPQIIENILLDPFNTDDNEYSYATAGDYYAVWSWGPDRGIDITGIVVNGELEGANFDEDIYVTNGPD